MKNPSLLLSRQYNPTLSLILGMVCAMLSGCTSWAKLTGYESERFSSAHVRVVHSEQHCRYVDRSAATQFPNADLVEISHHGIGYLVANRTAWGIIARQLAAELDADVALVRPCDGEGPFEHAEIEVWRTRGFKPIVQEEYHPKSGALIAPSQSTYGTRLRDIFDCFEQARVTHGPISPDNKKRLGHVDATEFFTRGRYFPAYARVDKYFRPTRTGDLSLAMINSDRARANWAAGVYWELSADEKSRFGERYLICLFDRGYSW